MTAVTLDQREFRNALGRFATGVAIMTTAGRDARPVGLTANSFSSVSLDPSLILWSLRRNAPSLPDFMEADHFAVNVLTSKQMELSNRFARPCDKFDSLRWHPGMGGAPLLEDCLARFQCRSVQQVDGGDHVIFIGEVMEFDYDDGEPLVYFSGAYRVAAPHPRVPA